MTPDAIFRAPDWDGIDLVAFDVDGTLYRQRPLRLRIARDMLVHAARTRSLEVPRALGRYRRIRERLGEEEATDFETRLITETAEVTGLSPDAVSRIVADWIDRRPLPYLAACCYPGLPALFDGLRRRGKRIGILSDYPVAAKLHALGLSADHIVSACDRDVALLKPHPRGLQALMAKAGGGPARTVLIGDRVERDGLAARRAGARALIRSGKPFAGWTTFARFDDPVFAPILRA